MAELKKYTDSCIHGAPAPCMHECPLNVDVKKVLGKIAAGNFDSAYREYRKQAVFPAIVSKLCKQQPCMKDCPSKLSMLLLEQACIENAKSHSPEKYNLPKRQKSVAIIGAGISGLACVQRLAMKRYKVTLFERKEEIGGSLQDLLPKEEYLPELRQQLSESEYVFLAGREVHTLDELEALRFDAVYIATGASGSDFGLLNGWNQRTLATAREGVFLGGSLTGCGKIEALSHGVRAALSIETCFKTGRLDNEADTPDRKERCIKPHLVHGQSCNRIDLDGLPYDQNAAMSEAARCLHCDCTICYDTCEFMKEQGLMPREIEVKAINIRGPVTRVSNKLIASCALCGHCEAVCEFNASMEMAMRRSKQALFQEGGFAPAYHDYYMRDLQDAMGAAYLCKHPLKQKHASYLFFPGCQAAGANPAYVTAPYRYMLEHDPDTAIILGCCGVPALYAGDTETMRIVHEKILKDIHELSDPVIVLSCATCAKTFDEFLPEVRWISLYEYMMEKGIPAQARNLDGNWALFDPCASRKFAQMQDAVRYLLNAISLKFSELPENRNHALCCGQGGHIYAANPKLSKRITEVAVAQSKFPYMTYCTNCRELFLSAGKKTAYLLDALFDIDPLTSPVHILQKHRNRYAARTALLQEIWQEEPSGHMSSFDEMYNLSILESLLRKMDQKMISESEIKEVIDSSEKSQKYLVDQSTGIRIGYKKIGYVTIWAEYRIDGKEVYVLNAYCHRITFE